MTDEVVQGRDPVRPPTGGRHRRTLVMAAVVLAFLAVVVVVGVVRGKPEAAPKASGSATPSASSDTGTGAPLTLTNVRCAKLADDRLTVGFGVSNRGTTTMTIEELDPTFPLGGLTPTPAASPDPTACPTPEGRLPVTIAPGGSALLAFVLTPADPRCIAPLPVDVEVTYDVTDRISSPAQFHVFPDLGEFGLPGDCSSPSS